MADALLPDLSSQVSEPLFDRPSIGLNGAKTRLAPRTALAWPPLAIGNRPRWPVLADASCLRRLPARRQAGQT